MSNGVIAFLVGLGAATWVGRWFSHRTGGNSTKSIIGGLVAGILAFLLMLTILWQAS